MVKSLQLFVDIICIFVFLTLGSLMLIVASQILPMEDALIKVQEIYENGFEQLRFGITGLLFIFVGLQMTRSFIKRTRRDDDFFIVDGDTGRLTITYYALNQTVERILKRHEAVRQASVSTQYIKQELRISAFVQVLPGQDLAKLSAHAEKEVRAKVYKMLRCEIPIQFKLNVTRIEELMQTSGLKVD